MDEMDWVLLDAMKMDHGISIVSQLKSWIIVIQTFANGSWSMNYGHLRKWQQIDLSSADPTSCHLLLSWCWLRLRLRLKWCWQWIFFGSESESTQWLIWTRTDTGQLINKVSGYLLVQKHCSVSVGAEFRSALEADTIGLHPLCHSALIADQKISKHLKLCSALDVQL